MEEFPANSLRLFDLASAASNLVRGVCTLHKCMYTCRGAIAQRFLSLQLSFQGSDIFRIVRCYLILVYHAISSYEYSGRDDCLTC